MEEQVLYRRSIRDTELSFPDDMRCDICFKNVSRKYCAVCQTSLCETCESKHVSNTSNRHYILPFKLRKYICRCKKHHSNICEFTCEQCNIPLCILCLSSEKHKQHKTEDILKYLESKEKMQNDLEELEKSIFPKYQEAAANIPDKKAAANAKFTKIKTAVNEQGEVFHKAVKSIIRKMHSEIDSMGSKHLRAIEKQEGQINHTCPLVKTKIADIKKMLDSDDIDNAFAYKSINGELRRFPAPIYVSSSTFELKEMSKEMVIQIGKQFGVLRKLTITHPLLDKPLILSEIFPFGILDIEIPYFVLRVFCMNNEIFWSSSFLSNTVSLRDVSGNILKTIQTQSGNPPRDITVTQRGELVYTDFKDRSVNLVREITTLKTVLGLEEQKTQIRPFIPQQEWKPRCVCCSKISGDLLVTMDNENQSKVVRYSGIPGFTEKQSIQWDDQGQPLYSRGEDITENRNSDICVADSGAIVVVTEDGKLRFRYTGPPSANKELFNACAITTDSLGKILIADLTSKFIHILDQDGHIFHYLYITGLDKIWALCVDPSDNVFAVETFTGKVKKIKYYK